MTAMKTNVRNLLVPILLLSLACGLTALWPARVDAQLLYPPPASTTPDAQRNAVNSMRAQVGSVQNATRTAPNFATGAYDMVWESFQAMRAAFGGFKSTLTPQQSAAGANELAELDAGLDILQEAFPGYQEDLAAGRSNSAALRSLCGVLDQAAGVWLQEFNQDCRKLRVGL
jgi:hypothetical protein